MRVNAWIRIAAVATLVGSQIGCNATVGTSILSVPSDSASQCATHCSSIGMGLDSVVIMASNVGCVCRAQPTKASTANEKPVGAAVGMAALMVQRQAVAPQPIR
jgi:hypothetical protein